MEENAIYRNPDTIDVMESTLNHLFGNVDDAPFFLCWISRCKIMEEKIANIHMTVFVTHTAGLVTEAFDMLRAQKRITLFIQQLINFKFTQLASFRLTFAIDRILSP